MPGFVPADARYARRERNLDLNRVTVAYANPDTRPRGFVTDVPGKTEIIPKP